MIRFTVSIKPYTFFLVWVLAFCLTRPEAALAQSGGAGATIAYTLPEEFDYRTHQNIDSRLRPDGVGLLGDQIDPNTGSIVFEHVDVSLPGNSGLEVALRRRARQMNLRNEIAEQSGFGDWSISTPLMHFMYVRDYADFQYREDQLAPRLPMVTADCPTIPSGAIVEPPNFPTSPELPPPLDLFSRDYSNGFRLVIPGRGEQLLLEKNQTSSPFPASAAYVTIANWKVHCDAGAGGYIATAPNGDRYSFTKKVYRRAPEYDIGLTTPQVQSDPVLFPYQREYVVLLATEVRDVNGNWVRYEYTNDERAELTRIHSNDGREILIEYATGDLPALSNSRLITQVKANGRIWRYDYHAWSAQRYLLSQVTLPDARQWVFGGGQGLDELHFGPSLQFECPIIEQTLSLQHPNGVIGSFRLRETRHLKGDSQEIPNPSSYSVHPAAPCGNPAVFNPEPPFFRSISVVEKTLSGPDYDTAQWAYAYSGFIDGVVPATKWTEVIDPLGRKTRYVYDRTGTTDGLLLEERVFSASGLLTQTISNSYFVENPIGDYGLDWNPNASPAYVNYSKDTRPRHITQRTITRASDNFSTRYTYNTNQSSASYSYGNPTKAELWSSAAPSDVRVTDTVYQHDKTNWIIGLPNTVTRNGKLFDDYDYDALGRVTAHKRFGQDYKTFGYHGSGTQGGALAWAEDALSRRTSFDNYKRGIPQLVTRPDLTPLSRAVDDNGWVTSQTNARGVTTSYEYNTVGWLTKIDRPAPWSDTTIGYAGLGSGAVQTSTRGSARTTMTYDGLFRPTLVKNEALSGGGVTTYVKTDYDAFGQVTFTSYPSTSSSPTVGMETRYDVLGRVIETRETVAPFATTTTAYLSGNRTRVTDPLGYSTTTTLRAYGSPDHGDVIRIEQPEGVTTDMTYDDWGNMLTATQGGGGVSQTQRYVYDNRLRLCRHSVRETRDTLYDYDAADQMTHVARGQSAGTSCPTSMPSGETVIRTYDALGRVDVVNYPGVTPDIDFDYDLNGNVTRNARGSAVWDYIYDTADQLTEEKLTVDGRVYTTNYLFDANAYLVSQTTPAGRIVSYGPNGLGQATRAEVAGSNYASGMSYHADGSLSALTFGNGQALTRSLNARQLVDGLVVAKSGGATAVDLTYAYDANGRIVEKVDRATPVIAGPVTPRTVEAQYHADKRLRRFRDTLEGNTWQYISYDTRGNVRDTGTVGLGGLDITYDAAEQPTSIGGAVTGSFVYDGNLKRVKQTIGGETIYSVYSQSGAILYRDNVTTGEATDYIRANGMTLARLRGGVTTFPHADHLGSPVAATDSGGNVLWREQYTAFGEKRLDPALNVDNEGFTGHIDDAATGLTYMQARYYDPVLGRFLSNDPVAFAPDRPQYFNRYAYALNNPVNMIDPDGRNAIIADPQFQRDHLSPADQASFAEGEAAAVAVLIGGASLFVPDPTDLAIAGVLAKLAGGGKGLNLSLKAKQGWTDAQKAQAAQKVSALDAAAKKGKLSVVKNPQRSATSASARYRRAGNEVPSGSDVDHVQDLQLGGSDNISNMAPLDSSVNRSLGSQIQHQIKDALPGTKVCSVDIEGC